MKLDVVVVTYRSADSIEACLASIPSGHRIIVVENASGDDAPKIARSLGAEVIENSRNLGFGAAANQGARGGDADAILFLNPDARLAPETIEQMCAALDEPDVAVVGAQLVYPDGSLQKSVWPYPSPWKQWAEAFGAHRVVPQRGQFVVGACFLVWRSAFETLGGFDERYWLYGEEADLCRRAEDAGWKVVLVAGAVCHHEGGASGRESSQLVAEHFAYGSDRFVAIHHGRAALVSYRLAVLAGALLRYPVLRALRPGDPRVHARAFAIRRVLRALLRHPLSVPDSPVGSRPRQVVVLSLEPWDDIWRRNQFLVRELLRSDPDTQVLWVEPPSDPLHEMLSLRRLPDRRPRTLRPVHHEPRVLRFQPRKWLPRKLWPGVDASLARQVRSMMRRAGFVDAVLWVNDCTYAQLVTGGLNRAVYDITDDWIDSGVPAREQDRLRSLDATLLEASDEVVVCSPELARRRSTIRPVHLIPNAVDLDHFRGPVPRPADLPDGPLAVYVGSLHDDRIDVELVARCAADLPDAAFVFVGPNSLSPASLHKLSQRSNVHLLGPRPYSQVPGYLQHADVVIVPHVVTPFTQSLDPIKAYECMAVGRPTLATEVNGFVGLPSPVVTASRSTFSSVLSHMLSENQPCSPTDPPSWAERGDEFASVLFGGSEVEGDDKRSTLRVVYLDHTALASGGELALLRLLRGLPHVDPHVILATDGPFRELLSEQGIHVEVLPMDERARDTKRDSVKPGSLPFAALMRTVTYTWKTSRRLRALRPDVVHTNSLKAAIYGGVAARLAGVPVVWHVRDRIAEDYLPRFAVRAIRMLARVVPNAIISNSLATRATLGKAGVDTPVAPSPVVYDPLPADFARPASAPSEHLTYGMVGRLSPWKGQDVFLRAFAMAFADTEERAVLVGGALFGEDAYEASLHALVSELQLEGRVTFTGHVADVAQHLAGVDVLVHASVIPEPFGQVVLEGMAAGKAVIASAAGGPLELVTDGVDGILTPPGDIDALADAMKSLASADTRGRLARAAAIRARSFSPEIIGREVETVYRRLVARRRF